MFTVADVLHLLLDNFVNNYKSSPMFIATTTYFVGQSSKITDTVSQEAIKMAAEFVREVNSKAWDQARWAEVIPQRGMSMTRSTQPT